MRSDFTTTCWTLVLDAASTCPVESRPALEALCRQYWEPLYAYARGSGMTHQDAQDTTQSFFEHLLETNLAGRATPNRGRFRSFLLGALRNFMHAEHRNATTQKRGGDAGPHLSMSQHPDLADEIITSETPEAAYERKWAHTVVNIALDKLATEQAATGTAARFAALRPLLLDPARGTNAQADLSARLGMTDGSIRTAMSRLRARFRDIVRKEVSRLVADPAEIDDEIAHLLRALR